MNTPPISPETHAAIARHNAAAMGAIIGIMHEPPAEPLPDISEFVRFMQVSLRYPELPLASNLKSGIAFLRGYSLQGSRADGRSIAEYRVQLAEIAACLKYLLELQETSEAAR